ncbi:hypothetical protein B0T26DRAFT_676220 [Lasiosphaeria miniovina]|uniref:Uncharacterized protein n=1 Tax=Lasiosphaeria miniovina TaxID=1954250 RepID=A0AA40ALD2_9PEZI|nr:uncharacterized protein B0T26DRAFT_676220 [Lasiosphaeria miniovina]KAK0717991.1 hypothetical protein B0T26DRAFT_676220 [Lasiosphaeria miniovina]
MLSVAASAAAGPSRIPPVKRRRMTETTASPIYGPLADDRLQRNLGEVLLTEQNYEFRQKWKTMFEIAITKKSSMPIHQAKYLAEHEDVSGQGQTIARMKKITHLRNTVPEFVAYDQVYFDYTRSYWLVEMFSLRSKLGRPVDIPLFVGQCPVHVREAPGILPLSNPYIYVHDLDVHLDSRAVASDLTCQTIAEAFPCSIGMRVLVYGAVEILYRNDKARRKDMRNIKSWPRDIGIDHAYTLKVVEVELTASQTAFPFSHAGFGHPGPRGAVQPSVPVASEMSNLNPKGCAGLRIRREGDTHDSWTTVTHPWLQGAAPFSMGKLERSVRMFGANIATVAKRTKGWLNKDRERSAKSRGQQQVILGTDIYVAGEKTKIGTISACYDNPLSLEVGLLFPLGIEHDLSLITASEGALLSPMTQIPKHARIAKTFITPNEILNADNDNRDWRGGHFVIGAARNAVVAGTEYWWEQRHLKIKRAIIWRTLIDDWSLQGGSGGVVCLGNPAAETCRAAAFQNYQSESMLTNTFWKQDVRRKLKGFHPQCSFKAGFILPEDVQNATIVFDEDVVPQERRSVSGPSGPVHPDGPVKPVVARKKENRTDN